MVIDAITKRRSVREYKNDDVPQELIEQIVKAGQFAPSANCNMAVEFIVVRNQETKNKIFKIIGQDFVKNAPVLIIPATDKTKTVCPVEDLSVASENMFLQATTLGLGTVWKTIQGENEENIIKELLDIPDKFKIINVIPVGYPVEEPKPHMDADFSLTKIHKEEW